MPRASKEKGHKRKRSKHGAPSEYKLLTYAALGQYNKLIKLLQKRSGIDIDFYDAQGNTPLHESEPAPDVEAKNANGHSIQQLAADAMALSSDTDDETAAAQQPKRARHTHKQTDGVEVEASEDEEVEWQARLREESGAELRGGDDDDWDSYGGFFQQPNVGQAQTEDEDAFARRIWQEMEKRKRQQTDDATAARSYFAAEREAATARQQAEFDAAQRSRRILDEEKAKDRAWREAVQKGDLGSRRAKYEARWHVFVSSDSSQPIRFSDVPWLVEDLTQDQAQLAEFVLYGTSSVEERRKRSRAELMRWHPDKFIAKFGARLAAQDKSQILERVNAMSQLLNSVGTGAS